MNYMVITACEIKKHSSYGGANDVPGLSYCQVLVCGGLENNTIKTTSRTTKNCTVELKLGEVCLGLGKRTVFRDGRVWLEDLAEVGIALSDRRATE